MMRKSSVAGIAAVLLFCSGAFFVDGRADFLFDSTPAFDAGGEFAEEAVCADLDGDSYPDLAVVSDSGVSILRGLADGIFSEAVSYVGNRAESVTSGDFDGDGDLDLAMAMAYVSEVCILLNNGDGTFAPPAYFTGEYRLRNIKAGDLDGDGDLDLAVAGYEDIPYRGKALIFLGQGDGSFTFTAEYAAGDLSSTVAMADLENDGDLDLVLANADSDDISILLGHGDGSFAGHVDVPVGGGPWHVLLVDLDGDEAEDVVTANRMSNSLSVLRGHGDGTFGPAELYPLGEDPIATAVDDVDGDGVLDLLVADFGYMRVSPSTVAVLRGQGDGTFTDPEHYRAGGNAMFICPGDFDLDGQRDAAVVNYRSGGVTLLRGAGEGRYLDARSSAVGDHPRNMFGTDLNGDGHLDIVLSDGGEYPTYQYGISALLGRGDGSFAPTLWQPVDHFYYSANIGDLNNDGAPDIVLGYPGDAPGSTELTVYIARGDGTFYPGGSFPAGGEAWVIALEDFDGDGIRDLACCCNIPEIGDKLRLYRGLGDGTFSVWVNYPVGFNPTGGTAADLNGDGRLDLVVTYSGRYPEYNGGVTAYTSDGDGNFVIASDIQIGKLVSHLTAGDYDGDGFPDLVVSYSDGEWETFGFAVLGGRGDGTFDQPIHHATEKSHRGLESGDVTGDGDLDLVMACQDKDWIAVYPGLGDGSFAAPLRFATGEGPIDLVLGDFDEDGDLDAVAADGYDADVWFLANNGVDLPHDWQSAIVAGAGPAAGNAPRVRVFLPGQGAEPAYEFDAYGAPHYGVNVTMGNLDGGPDEEILTGAGPGEIYGPHVRGFQPEGSPMPGLSFLAYGTNRFGVNVAAGDIDGDGFDEIITGPGPGDVFGPHVRAFDYDGVPPVTPLAEVSFFAYGTLHWGVRVAAGDIDGDGFDEILTGPGPGSQFGPQVRGWNVDGGSAAPMAAVNFMAYGTNQFGVVVSCGDLDGDGIDEIVTAPGPGSSFGAHVRGWNYDGSVITPIAGCSFLAWPLVEARYGARIFAGDDLDGDGRDDLVVGAGPDPAVGTPIKVFTYDGTGVSPLHSFDAFPPEWTHGTSVAALKH